MDSNPQHNPQNNAQHTREVRFAVVLYGGVSLAVYLSGIVQELLHLVQASAPGGDRHGGGASRVYRKLAQLLKDGQLDVDGADEDGHVDVPSSAPVRTRFVIDIITGASAGGLNGVFLAKALVLDKNLDLITDLWLREGDIARRLHDRRATTGTTLPNPGPPASLLSGQGMLHVLLKGLDQLSRQGSGAAAADRSPNVDELDLWVTVTDLEGRPVSTSTFNPDQLGEIRESQHRATFHFRYADPAKPGEAQAAKPGEAQAVNDFLRRYDPMLAFAARCTSSFPGGFEPARLADLVPVMASLMPAQARKSPIQSDAWARIAGSRTPFHLGNEWADVTELDRFFTDYGTAEEGARRSFSDGGILNNQPVDLVMATLPKRRAEVPVSRRVLIVDPSPDSPRSPDDTGGPDGPGGPGPDGRGTRVDLIGSVSKALSLPRVQNIGGEVERILALREPARLRAAQYQVLDERLASPGGSRSRLRRS